MKEETNQTIYWSLLIHDAWRLYLAATSAGLCYVGSQNKSLDELSDWTSSRYPGRTLVQNDEKLKPYTEELIQYLQGERTAFTIPFDCQGTSFQLAVWQALRDIPYGQTKSYSDIANHIDKPAAVRAVGTAIGANPILITVPCHRVIGKNGSLTGYRGGLDMKTQLLQLERGTSLVDMDGRKAT